MYGVPTPEQQGFTVQSGYEGFIFPSGPPAKDTGLEHSALGALGSVALGYKLLTHLLPFPLNKIALFLGTKIGFWLLGLMLLLLIGGATTTAVCALTPLCTIRSVLFKNISHLYLLFLFLLTKRYFNK